MNKAASPYKVRLHDMGVCDFKETWEFQAAVFVEMTSAKKSARSGMPSGTLIFVEHPHVYTIGKSGSESNMLTDTGGIQNIGASFYKIDRGGDITYHGPGQIVCYPIFDLDALNIGLKQYIYNLEESIIRVVGEYGLEASRLEGKAGVWIDPQVEGRTRKICAIGVKASRFVTMHGLALNVNTDLTYFSLINPCGFTDKGVTSLERELGEKQSMDVAKRVVGEKLKEIFNLEII